MKVFKLDKFLEYHQGERNWSREDFKEKIKYLSTLEDRVCFPYGKIKKLYYCYDNNGHPVWFEENELEII